MPYNTFEDADVDTAVEMAAGRFNNNGRAV
jgi:hypothetical protein